MSNKEVSAKLLISIAAWPPGECGPNGEWELRSKETGLPLLCCNRTGYEPGIDFSKSESVVIANGKRILTFSSPKSTIFFVDMNLEYMQFLYKGALYL